METERPWISIIIPTLDEADELERTLSSVERAFGSDREVIVADGGSTDGTREVARQRATVVVAPRGRGRQLNAGARAARGEVLLFLHADTWLPPEAGRALRAAFEKLTLLVGGCFEVRLRGPSARRPIARVLTVAINARSRWFVTATGDQAIFARRSAFEAIGGFSEQPLFEDVLFYRALRSLGPVHLLRPPVLTSDRRWRKLGYVRTISKHLTLRLMMLAGASPAALARRYRTVR